MGKEHQWLVVVRFVFFCITRLPYFKWLITAFPELVRYSRKWKRWGQSSLRSAWCHFWLLWCHIRNSFSKAVHQIHIPPRNQNTFCQETFRALSALSEAFSKKPVTLRWKRWCQKHQCRGSVETKQGPFTLLAGLSPLPCLMLSPLAGAWQS